VVRKLEADQPQRPVLLQQQRRHCLWWHPAVDTGGASVQPL
jgi:hypothetical protein